jgi:hypothetical protein
MTLPARTLFSRTGVVLLLAGWLAACSDSTTSPGTLDAPAGVAVVATSETSAQITWDQVPGAQTYDVDRAEGPFTTAAASLTGTLDDAGQEPRLSQAVGAGDYVNIATGLTSTVYDDTTLQPNTAYRYRVTALNGGTKSSTSTEAAVTTPEGAKVAKVTGIPLSRTFYADTLYVLQGYVKVSNGATLTIEAGTKIVGDTLVTGSSLWILRGSKIMANGTADAPIVFTSQRAAGNRKPGDWGGIIIVGNGLINRTASPIFTEGPTGAAEDYSGGTNFDDNSGVLKYVRVEFAGYDVSNGGGQELNSISNYAVGRGTTLDYVEMMAGLDDGIESFGGAGDYRHLVSFETGDDHFDWTEGFQGRAQYLIALQTSVLQPRPGTGTVSSDPRGFEGDGCEIDKAGCTFANTPYSMPVWANFTVIGPGTGVFSTTDGNGAVVRRGSAGNFVNGIIARWPGVGMSVRDQESKDRMDEDSLFIRNIVLADNGSNFEAPATGKFGYVLSDSATAWNIMTSTLGALFSGALPTSGTTVTTANLNIGLASGATAATGGLSSFPSVLSARVQNFFGGTMPATSYIGAVDPSATTQWFAGWTNWERN